MAKRPRPRLTRRALGAVGLAVVGLLGLASATAWADWGSLIGDGWETFADVERRPRGVPGDTPGGRDGAPPAAEDPDAGDDGGPAGSGSEPSGPGEPAERSDDASDDREEPGAGKVALLAPDGAPDAGAAVGPDPATARELRVQHALEHWLRQHPDVRSVAVAVRAGGPQGERWAGAAVADPAEPVIDHTAVYPIMSVTKTFTEALVLQHAAAGTIDLDAPMPPMPDVAPVPDGVQITPRMLLQHSSGLVNYVDADGYDPSAPMTPAHAVSLSLGTPLLAEPGTRTHYSNSNFHWLGLLLEHATGRPFAELVADLATQYDLPSASVDPGAQPGWVGFASGGMRATLPDLARWGSHLFTPGSVLTPSDLEAYLEVGALGVGLGVWPICPCTTAPDGTVDYAAIGQIVADGGLLYFPDDDVVVAVRLAHVPGDVGATTSSVAGAVAMAFANAPMARVQ